MERTPVNSMETLISLIEEYGLSIPADGILIRDNVTWSVKDFSGKKIPKWFDLKSPSSIKLLKIFATFEQPTHAVKKFMDSNMFNIMVKYLGHNYTINISLSMLPNASVTINITFTFPKHAKLSIYISETSKYFFVSCSIKLFIIL